MTDAAAELLRRAEPASAAVYDELRDRDGRLRDAWRRFAGWLPSRGLEAELDERTAQVARQIHADGVTHNVYGRDGATSRPWSLELLPQFVEPADWAEIERGIVQRARLLDAMLGDLYGDQRLLHEGLLPPALVYRHPGYLRPLRGVVPPGRLYLHIAAFDIVRGPDGGWTVVAHRTQGPSGLGYVLHNRLIVSRQFPQAFREMRVQHIASSYRRLLDTVEAQAGEIAGGEPPRVALLTPGAFNETYFEHAYLARYLGLPLVEGGDLTLRGDRLYLKTVEGLEPLHALVRRLDDDFCDPLELRPDSTLGVPGLLQAVRAGRVVMANALGSGFLESPALHAYLPAIARRLLGEDLHLPGVSTWWCGDDAARAAARAAERDVQWRAAYGTASAGDGVEADPHAWAVQARLVPSRAPLWRGGALVARPAVLRVYAVADGDGRWHLLPGAMTRVAAHDGAPTGDDAQDVSMQHGGSSLDTWVLTDGPVDSFSMLPQRLQVADLAARRRPVASRAAENLFWLGRYTERTEQLVRLARAALVLVDTETSIPTPVLQALGTLSPRMGLVPAAAPSPADAPLAYEHALLQALGDPDATSVASNLAQLARAAGALRDRLSPEHWGLVQSMREDLGRPADVADALAALDRLAVLLAAVTGAQSDRMTRDHGWRLLTIGRYLERLVGACGQLDTLLGCEAHGHEMGIELLLELFDSRITFRARYQRHDDVIALADLLVFDDTNPRAFACAVHRLRTELHKLPASMAPALREGLPARGVGLSIDTLAGQGDDAVVLRLRALAQDLRAAGSQLSDDIGAHYFALVHGAPPHRV